MTPGHSQFVPQWHGWQDLCREPLTIATYKLHKSCGPHGFRDFLVFPIISLWKLMTLGTWTFWTPRGMVGNIFPIIISSYDLFVDIWI